METGKKTICIALPNAGHFNWQTVGSFLGLEVPPGFRFNFNIMSNCLIYDARERMAEYAIQNNFEYIFFLDSDMIPPRHTIMSLISHNQDIVTGMIFKRKYPFQPCFYTKAHVDKDYNPYMEGPMEPEKWPSEGALEIAGCGMACCLIKTEIFKKIQKPWFFPLPKAGEDLSFCMKARKAGFHIFVDFGVDCGHLNLFPIVKNSFQMALNEWLKDPKNQGKLIYNDDEG